MKKIDLTEEIKNKNGDLTILQVKEIQIVKDEEGVPHEEVDMVPKVLTLGEMLSGSCINEDYRDDGEGEIIKRYNLFLKIKGNDEVELDDKEFKLIKELVCIKYSVFFAGSVLTILNK